MENILKELSNEQQNACTSLNNIMLTACPGSGKTRTLTHRLAYQVLREPDSKKIKIAITYTNRAAEEIINRLEGMPLDLSSIWTGTIHQFCMHFIIRPYAMYSKRLCKGYRIIDDYSKKRMAGRLPSVWECISTIMKIPFNMKILELNINVYWRKIKKSILTRFFWFLKSY